MSSNNSRNQGSSREEEDTNQNFNLGSTKTLTEEEELDYQDFLVNEFSRDLEEDEDEKIEFDEIEAEMHKFQIQEEQTTVQSLKEKKLKNNCEPQSINAKELYDYAWLAEPHVQLPPQNHLYRDIFASKIGGVPNWLNDQEEYINYWELRKADKINEDYTKDEKFFEAEPIDAKKLTCKHCNDPLFLISQAYVPFGKFERVLYVFGCNRTSCSLKQDSYVAYRLQFKVIPKEALNPPTQEETVPKETEEMRVERERKQKEEEQRKLDSWNLTKSSESSSNIDDDIESLLQSRQSNASKSTDKKSSSQKATSKQTKPNERTTAQPPQKKKADNAFPCFSLDTFEDPLTEELDEEEEWEEEVDDEEEETDNSKSKNKLQDPKYAHEKELFEKYKQDLATGELEDFDDFDFENKNSQGDSSSLALKNKQETIENGLVKFQLVIDKAPTQSIRWFFRGAPVWISELPKHLPPKYSEVKKELEMQCSRMNPLEREDFQKTIPNQIFQKIVPKCEHCGSPRVFELEIIPTVIYKLNCSKHVLKKYAQDENEVGLEFGTISIFTCSRQCIPKQKNHYLKEFVFVQPAI